ncbi:MAG: hypothetical protein K8H90_02210 [Thermoanaerobaculia bacterium]|nr:hypothetical protein [Thermoanaerobaculia bacterium]
MPRLFLATALVLAAVPLAARDLFVNNLEGYTIARDVLEAPDCAGAVFDDVNLQAFERGLCVFHREGRSPQDAATAIGLLDQAQVRGLPPVHQQLAALLTGLARCSEAERHLAAFRASGNQDLLARTYFCRERRLAQAELDSIRWNHALFDYAEGLPAPLSLDVRFTEMGACHAGALSTDLDAECGLISNLTDTEINAFVDAAADEVIATYFTSVESPITAMFARKRGRAQGLLESAGASIAGLESSAAAVNAEYETLNGVYVEARDERMAPIYDAYREAILRATAILDEFERWKGGLFITAENVNLLPKIAERSIEIAEELERTQALEFRDRALALAADVRHLVDGKAQNRVTVAALCRIYFCELTARHDLEHTKQVCRRPALADNPLCIDQGGQPVSGVLTVEFEGTHSIAVGDLCRGAGVEAEFAVPDLAPSTAANCLSALP